MSETSFFFDLDHSLKMFQDMSGHIMLKIWAWKKSSLDLRDFKMKFIFQETRMLRTLKLCGLKSKIWKNSWAGWRRGLRPPKPKFKNSRANQKKKPKRPQKKKPHNTALAITPPEKHLAYLYFPSLTVIPFYVVHTIKLFLYSVSHRFEIQGAIC